MNTVTIVQKLWNYCNVLRDDGMSYGDYVEQLTYLLFLKMADERAQPPYKQPSPVLEQHAWSSWMLPRESGKTATNCLATVATPLKWCWGHGARGAPFHSIGLMLKGRSIRKTARTAVGNWRRKVNRA
jgi:hypothetical protein